MCFLLAAAVPLAARGRSRSGMGPWVFRADFAHGLTGWMSFPLVQDIGFDPSLFTATENGAAVLVRKIEPRGQRKLELGVIRPLKFFASARAEVQLSYALSVSGRLASLQIIMAGADGYRYAASLPRGPGDHAIVLTGMQFALPASAAKIQAVILLARIASPTAGSKESLTLRKFEIHAERPPEVPLAVPELIRSGVGRVIVSRRVLTVGSRLRVRLRSPQPGARLKVASPSGKQEAEIPFAPNGSTSFALSSESAPGLWTATVTRGDARTDFNFLVLGSHLPHPRILLGKDRLAELRQLPRYARLREQIHRQAHELAAGIAYNPTAGANIAHLPGGTGLRPDFVGELKAYFELLDSYSNAISYNALDYTLNGDQTSFQAARRALLTVAQWQTWTPPRFTSHGLHTYYEVGVFAQRVALGYDLIAPRLTAKEKRQVADAFWRQIIEPTVKEYFLYNRMPLAASNWMANSLGGALAADVATEGDVADWNEREGAALGELLAAYQQLLKGLFPGDGSEAEPAGYENFAMRGLSWGEAALHAVGIRPQGAWRMAEGFWWPAYAMVRPGLVLDTGDFNGRLETLPGFAWGAEHAGIPALRSFYDRTSQHIVFAVPSNVGNMGRRVERASSPLDLVCCTQPSVKVPLPPPSRIFPGRGSAVLRSGWGVDSTVVSLRVGRWFNHEHHDEGSFQVAAFGRKLVSEAGYSAYYTDPNYPIYFIQAPGHNTVLLDGNPYSQKDYNGDFWAAYSRHPHFVAQLLSPAFDYLAADLTSAYAGRLTHYERDFFFLKPDLLIVRDQLAGAAPHIYSWLLHAPAGAKLSAGGNRATIQVSGASASFLAAGQAADWKTEATPISINKFNDLDHGVIHTPHELLLQSGRSKAATFLVGMLFEREGMPQPTLTKVSTAVAEGVEQKGAALRGVVFRTGPGALSWDDFSTDGNVLAVSGKQGREAVLAVDARTIERGARVEFRSSVPATVSLQHTKQGWEAHLSVSSPAAVQLGCAKAPSEVRVDGVPVRFKYRNGVITLRIARKGEHRVGIEP